MLFPHRGEYLEQVQMALARAKGGDIEEQAGILSEPEFRPHAGPFPLVIPFITLQQEGIVDHVDAVLRKIALQQSALPPVGVDQNRPYHPQGPVVQRE